MLVAPCGPLVFYHGHLRRCAISNKKDKQKEALLQQQQAEDRRRMELLMTQAAAPRPVETALEKEQLNWMDQTSGKNGPLDITSLTAMKPNLALYDAASKRQQGERMGIGALQMGANGANPMLGQLLRQQSDDQRQQDAAGGLENAYRLTDASMRGNMLPLLGMQQSRSMGLAGMASGNSNQSTNTWANFKPAPSFLQNLLMTGFGAAGQIGAAYAGK